MPKKTSLKKQIKVKNPVVKKLETAEKKALKSKALKVAAPARKKLGKGLEDISTLFLSDIKQDSASAKKKTVKPLVRKNVMPKVEKVKTPIAKKSVDLKTNDIVIRKSSKKNVVEIDKKAAAAKDSIFEKTIAKADKKNLVVKEIVSSKGNVSKVDKKASGVNDNVPKKTVAKLNKKTAVVKESVPEKAITRIDEKIYESKDINPKKTIALIDKKTAEKTTGGKLKKVAVKLATVKPIMKKTEVVGMGIFKKSSREDKKPSPAKLTEKKNVKLKTVSKTTESKKTQTLGPISELKTLFKKKKTVGLNGDAQNIETEQIIGDSKFFVSKGNVNRVKEDEIYDLPEGYGDNRIVIQVRDPYWLFAYWEVSQRKLNSVVEKYGNALHNARRVLRVYDITAIAFNGNNANSFFDITINDVAKNWYVNVGNPGRSYCIDIGLVLADGRFVVFARSNFVTTPIDGPSLVTDEEWMIVEDDFNKLYGLSAGLGIGLSSGELRKQIKTKLKNLSSGVLSSPGVTTAAPNRNFWMVVNTELIVYGATQPGAELTVQGKPIKLNEDGTFSLRFALPDGEQVIPVRAVSPDKVEERVITPVVKKNTV